MYKVFIKTDTHGRVIEINSSEFLQNPTEYIQIDEGEGDKYHHAQNNYFGKQLIDFDSSHNYIYDNSAVRESTSEEKVVELQALPLPMPSKEEQLRADIDYIAAIQGVVL